MRFQNELIDAGVVELTRMFAAGPTTPEQVIDAYLQRIERLNPQLKAILDRDETTARRQAKESGERWASGRALSKIDGVPIVVKANIAVAGLPWHAGIEAYRDRVASHDATVVQRLRAAGAVILGTANMHEAALGATTRNPWFGTCSNPHGEGFTPGGSSGGSAAAVAAGLCAAALGTDTLGSVRIPSAYCGVVGYKPTRDFIPVDGVIPLSWTLDHVGIHTRSVEDCAAVAEFAAARSIELPAFETFRGARLGVLDCHGQVELDTAIADGLAHAQEKAIRLGFRVERVRLQDYDFGRVRRLGLFLSEAEGSAVHEEMLAQNPSGFSKELRDMLQWGASRSALQLAKAYRTIALLAASIREQFALYAAVLMPTAPQVAFAFDEPVPTNQADLTAIANISGWSAVAFPIGVAGNGLPASLQFLASEDSMALALARSFSAAHFGGPR